MTFLQRIFSDLRNICIDICNVPMYNDINKTPAHLCIFH